MIGKTTLNDKPINVMVSLSVFQNKALLFSNVCMRLQSVQSFIQAHNKIISETYERGYHRTIWNAHISNWTFVTCWLSYIIFKWPRIVPKPEPEIQLSPEHDFVVIKSALNRYTSSFLMKQKMLVDSIINGGNVSSIQYQFNIRVVSTYTNKMCAKVSRKNT